MGWVCLLLSIYRLLSAPLSVVIRCHFFQELKKRKSIAFEEKEPYAVNNSITHNCLIQEI
jgi:hypothetical protein